MAGKVIKVLLVDDIPETRENLRKLLAFESDIEVVGAASTGREGLEIAQETRPDIVLMDINMPDMDGITATQMLGKAVPGTSVIMMSVQTEAEYLRKAMMAGARDFLNKPISGDDLYSTIRRVYESRPVVPEGYGVATPGGSPGGGKPKPKTSEGHLIVVYSPQGGSGVTTIATNMATAMMKEGTRVLLIDADLQFGDVGVFLNLQAKYSVADLTASVSDLDEDLIENVMVSHPSGLKVLLAPPSPEEAEKVVPNDLSETIGVLRGHYDYIIVDMPKRLDDLTLNLLDQAERIVLVATPTLPSIKNVRVMLDLFQALSYPDEKIVFVMNRVSQDKAGRAFIPVDAIEKNLKRPTQARIPLDEVTFLSAVNQGVSVIAKDTRQSPAKELVGLAETLRRSFNAPDEEEAAPAAKDDRPASRLGGLFRR